MDECGLENRPGQLLKQGFRLALSCNKSHCIDASAATEKLKQKRTCARLPCSLRAGQCCAACGYPLLVQATLMTPSRARFIDSPGGLCRWCWMSSGQLWLSPGALTFFQLSLQEPFPHLTITESTKAFVNTLTTHNRNTSRIQ